MAFGLSGTGLGFAISKQARSADGRCGRGRIVEWRGPLGPGGAQVYRVLVRRKPSKVYIEVREDQIELLPAERRPPDGLPKFASPVKK